MAEAFISCENLVKIYSMSGVEVVALQGLDLTVQPGEIVGIVGTSGSGKTTLLNVLGGLDRPSAGKVRVGERDLLKLSDAELDSYRLSQVGFVWQQTTRNLIPYLTALENVELPMRLANSSPSQRRQQAMHLLETLGLSQRGHHLPVQLSGGEQQRTAIAVALANQPRLLLADEPTGEVDSATASEIYAALRKINELYAMSILIVSHDPNLSRYTDRVVAIRDGKTSTEMVRSERQPVIEAPEQQTSGPAAGEAAHKPQEFEELVVLDGAGRLQIPRDFLETLNIGDRVQLELRDGSIVIHPVAGRGRTAAPVEAHTRPEELYVQPDQAPERAEGTGIARALRLTAQMRIFRRSHPAEKTEAARD
jgi:ABC-type lipoprotein export system ATPase subunit